MFLEQKDSRAVTTTLRVASEDRAHLCASRGLEMHVPRYGLEVRGQRLSPGVMRQCLGTLPLSQPKEQVLLASSG